jgi:hypothetical protein
MPPPDNASMVFEPKYWDHGAITVKEKQDRKGNIFVINWQNDGKPSDFTVRLDYRQANTREKVMTKTQEQYMALGMLVSMPMISEAQALSRSPNAMEPPINPIPMMPTFCLESI